MQVHDRPAGEKIPMNTSHSIEEKGPLPSVQHEEIVVRAREFWSRAGSPEGRDLEFWLAAEHELQLERESVAGAVAAGARAGSEPALFPAPAAAPVKTGGSTRPLPVSHRGNMPRKPRR